MVMGLFDFIFTRKKPPVTVPAGTTGVAAFAGKLTSWESSPSLQGPNLYLTLSNLIANTTIVATAVRYYQNLLGGTEWTSSPNQENPGPEADRAAELVKTGLFEANMLAPWSACVKKQALFRMYGFAMHEWTMRKRQSDGALVYASVEHRPQHTVEFWDFPEVNKPWVGIVQRPPQWGGYYYVPRSRLWYSVDSSLTDQPDGVGLLRHVVEHSRRLARYEQLEGWAYETDLRGIPVGRIPYRELQKYASDTGKSAAWVAEQCAAIETLVASHVKTPWQGITLDSETYVNTTSESGQISSVPKWALELLKGDAVGLAEINQVIERTNREIARALGVEFVMLGGDGKGSLALSEDKTSMFASVVESTLSEIAWSVRHDLVDPLLTLNGIDPEKYRPQVNPDPIATERIQVVVESLAKLATAGAVLMPDDPAIDQVRRRLHLAAQPAIAPDLMGPLSRTRAGLPPDPEDPEGVDVDVSDLEEPKPKTKSTFRRLLKTRPLGTTK